MRGTSPRHSTATGFRRGLSRDRGRGSPGGERPDLRRALPGVGGGSGAVSTSAAAPAVSPLPAVLEHPLVRFAVVAAAAVALAHGLDAWAQQYVVDTDIYDGDFGRLLRVMGFYPLWLMAATALFLTDWPRIREGASRRCCARRAAMMVVAPALSGVFAEVGKVLLRRLRPGAIPGEYAFRSWAERPFYSGGLGLPSSHTMVAFAAAAMLARLFPRAAPVWYLLAAGCGLSRVAAGAHYLSDVTVAAVLGWATAWLVWRWMRPASGGRDLSPGSQLPPSMDSVAAAFGSTDAQSAGLPKDSISLSTATPRR
ncbi:MAG: phosphatase PAP2 family protein [Gemmatimonadales bacterium]|nr:MAG: phosphatase PAP2 family protein [Gemmatimonadales bacterium]